MDVYVSTKHAVRLLDFGPWGWTTQPLLFTWEELMHEHRASGGCGAQRRSAGVRPESEAGCETQCAEPVLPELRLVEDVMHIQPGAAVAYGAPADVHMHMGDLSWDQVMARLVRQTREAAAK